MLYLPLSLSFFFFFNDTATTEIYTLSLHAALPIYGQLGVLCGLETIRTLNDQRIRTRHPVALVIFTNEEGARFQPAMIASGVMAGKIALEDAYGARDTDGVRLVDALERIGYLGSEPCVARPF